MRLLSTILFSCLFIQLHAQDGGEVNSMEVVIEKDAEITLPESSRLFQRIPEEKITFDSLKLTYNTKILKSEVNPFRLNYKALNFENSRSSETKPNYVKLGLGNYNSSLIEGSYNLDLKNAGHYSVFGFFDRYGNGPVYADESKFSNAKLKLKSFHTFDKLSLNSSVNFLNNNFRFYGTPTGVIDANDNESINAQSIQIETNLEGNRFENVYFSIHPTYSSTNFYEAGDSFNEESIFDLKTELRKKSKKNEWNYGVGLNQKQVQYSAGITNNRSQFDIAPFVGLRGDFVTIKTGMIATLAKDSTNSETKSYFYPSLDLIWNFENQFTIYGSFRSGLDIITLRKLQYQNAFLSDSLDLKNRNILADVHIQVSKRFSKKAYFKFGTRIELVENQHYLVNSLSDFRQFELIYDPGTFTKIDFNLAFDYRINNVIQLNAEAHFMQYNTSATLEPYHLPTFTYDLKATYQALKNLELGLNFNYLSGITARDNDLSTVDMKAIVDLGLSANYSLNGNIDLFIQANNLMNNNYERYLNYPSLGLNGKLGFIFRFK